MGFITEILSINSTINLKYRTSKHPKILKTFLFNKRKKELKKIIEQIKKIQMLSSEELFEYLEDMYHNDSKYGICLKCDRIIGQDSDREYFSAVFQFKIYNGVEVIILSPDVDGIDSDGKKCNTYMAQYSYVTNSKIVATLQLDGVISFTNSIGRQDSFSKEQAKDILTSAFVKSILNDISAYLLERVNASERIKDEK